MRVLFSVATALSIWFVAESVHSEELTPAQISNNLSDISGLPQSTTLSDLVTKFSANTIDSGLSDFTYNYRQGDGIPEGISSALSAFKLAASKQGYVVRDVELGPTYQTNVQRIAGQIDLGTLSARSEANGLRFGNEGSKVARLGYGLNLRLPNVAAVTGGEVGDGGDGGGGGASRGRSAALSTPQQEYDNGRIYGGSVVPAGSDVFEDSVAVIGNNKLCSGVLVSKNTVLTAAHCYCDGVLDEVLIGTSIISPVDRIKIDKTKSEVFRPCEQVKQDITKGDIALLRIERPATATPRAVGDLRTVLSEASVRAVGFGRTSSAIGFKYQVNIVIASYQCNGQGFQGIPDTQIYKCTPAFELVAAGLNRDTCGGDSGGPIYVFGEDGKPYVVGITSRATTPDAQCGPGGIYNLLSVSPLRAWLIQRGITFN